MSVDDMIEELDGLLANKRLLEIVKCGRDIEYNIHEAKNDLNILNSEGMEIKELIKLVNKYPEYATLTNVPLPPPPLPIPVPFELVIENAEIYVNCYYQESVYDALMLGKWHELAGDADNSQGPGFRETVKLVEVKDHVQDEDMVWVNIWWNSNGFFGVSGDFYESEAEAERGAEADSVQQVKVRRPKGC